jgi:hypothetical protein
VQSDPYSIALFICGFASLLLYLLSWWRSLYLYRAFCLLNLVIIDCGWFLNAGSQGTSQMFFFVVLISILALCPRRIRCWAVAAFVLNGLTLILLEYHAPGMIRHGSSRSDQVHDLIAGFLVAVTVCTLTLRSVLGAYERGHRELLAAHVELKRSIEENQALRGMLPMCAWCRQVREEDGKWVKFETYIQKHASVSVTHGICPVCAQQESRG